MPSFRLEQEMVPTIVEALPAIVQDHPSVMWTSEFAKGYRIIDIVAACAQDPRAVSCHWANVASALRRLTYPQMLVLAEIARKQRATPDYLAKFAWLPVSEIKEHYIGTFLRLGVVEKVSMRSYSLANPLPWLPDLTVTIEAKLSDWRGALKQAVYNKPAVDRSYAALPFDSFAHRADVIGEFLSYGVGLLGVTVEGAVEVLAQPREDARDEPDYQVTSLRILASILSPSGRWECWSSRREPAADEPVQPSFEPRRSRSGA